MIHGVGTDIAAVARLAALYEKHGERALEKLLAAVERADFEKARDPARFLAKRFAAKEAFGKALGTGIRPPAVLSAIAVTHDALGKPQLACCGQLQEMLENQGLVAHLSISDETDYAIAYVILERP